jgi:hypothetical protein
MLLDCSALSHQACTPVARGVPTPERIQDTEPQNRAVCGRLRQDQDDDQLNHHGKAYLGEASKTLFADLGNGTLGGV